MYRILITFSILIIICFSAFGQQPDITVDGCEINGRVYQDRTGRPPTYLGLPVYFDNGVFIDLPGLGMNYPCYRAAPAGGTCRLCLNKTIFGSCYSYSTTIGNLYTFSYSALNCPFDELIWLLVIGSGLMTIILLRRSRK